MYLKKKTHRGSIGPPPVCALFVLLHAFGIIRHDGNHMAVSDIKYTVMRFFNGDVIRSGINQPSSDNASDGLNDKP